MFELSQPWWELTLRAVAVYAALLVLMRVSGKRTVGQFTPFDLLVVMLLSEAVSNSLSGGDGSITGGLIVAVTLIALNALIGFSASRSEYMEHLIDGVPVLVARDGKIFESVLRRHRVSEGDMDKALREADCSRDELACAFLEADGNISVLKRRKE